MKFAADAMLGRLAKWLRVIGYDTFFKADIDDAGLVEIAEAEGRIILTRDTVLAGRLPATGRLLIRDSAPFSQLRQVVAELGLALTEEALLTRCTVCNGALEDASKESVRGLVPEYVFGTNESFTRCLSCGRVYWTGTHRARIIAKLQSLGLEVKRA